MSQLYEWIKIESDKDFPPLPGWYHVEYGPLRDRSCWTRTDIITKFNEGLADIYLLSPISAGQKYETPNKIFERYRDDSKFPNLNEVVLSKRDCIAAMIEFAAQFVRGGNLDASEYDKEFYSNFIDICEGRYVQKLKP